MGEVGRTVGRFEVVPVLDGAGAFTLGSLEASFPGATAKDWDRARLVDKAAFGLDGRWHLAFRSYVVRDASGKCVLVDTGIGPSGSLASTWAPTPGRLPESLAEAGIGPDDVDVVVLTHLHTDHVGWSVGPDGRPTFPRARHLVQRADVAAVAGSTIEDAVVAPLRDAGLLWEADGAVRVLGGGHERVSTVPTPGHTPGHQCVLLEAEDEQLLLAGDLLVHAVQLGNVDVGYAHESDPELAAASRRTVLASLRRDALLATAHLTRPFVALAEAPPVRADPRPRP